MSQGPMPRPFDTTLTGRLRLALQPGLPLPAEAGPPLLQPAAEVPTAPALLAQAHAGSRARHEAQLLYTRCLRHFRLQVQDGSDLDDAALAAAYFVLASLTAARGLRPAADDLLRVEQQMRQRLGAGGVWLQAPLADRQNAFEQFALLGVLMSESAWAASQQGPAALANVRRAARGYLLQMLGAGADRLVLTPQGLALELAAA
jgi:hypothetical protein